jgi:hypothetical protein
MPRRRDPFQKSLNPRTAPWLNCCRCVFNANRRDRPAVVYAKAKSLLRECDLKLSRGPHLSYRTSLIEGAISYEQDGTFLPDAVRELRNRSQIALQYFPTTVSLRGSTMAHHHIRWSSGRLDWERFSTVEQAEKSARQLMRDGETFLVEEHDDVSCEQCLNLLDLSGTRGASEQVRKKLGAANRFL